jgi:predicted dehydrogenase
MRNILQSQPISFGPDPTRDSFENIALIGAGDVVQTRMVPALKAKSLQHLRAAVCSLEPESPIRNYPHRYYRVLPKNLLPLDELAHDGFLNDRTLWIVATPPQVHASFILMLHGLCGRIAVEKPIANEAWEARVLSPLAFGSRPVLPMDHKLFTADCLRFLDDCKRLGSPLREVRRIEGVFFEKAGFAMGREQEESVKDVGWHMLAVLVAAFKYLEKPFALSVDGATTAQYDADPSNQFADARVATASRLLGNLIAEDVKASFQLQQAKGAPHNEKWIRFYGPGNQIVAQVDLGESGWMPHQRMLETLILPTADMRHSLSDSIALANLLGGVSQHASRENSYPFGGLPPFLSECLTA